MSETVLDLTKICRTCKCEFPLMLSLYENEENPRLDEMLMACTSLKINSNDGLPNSICCKCVTILRDFYEFKRQCAEIDSSLRQYTKGLVDNNGNGEIKQELHNSTAHGSLIDEILRENTDEKTETGKTAIKNNHSDFIDLLDNNEMLLTCRECAKNFLTIESLRIHKKRSHLINLYKCKLCNKTYTRQTHLQRHLLTHHKENNLKYKLHICKICNKTLSTRTEHLRRHLVTHLKDKPFECKQCKRGFNRSDHLDIHVKRCKGLLQHICNVCNRGFLRLDSLLVHQKLHDQNKLQIGQIQLPTINDLYDINKYFCQIDFDPANNDNNYFNDEDSDSEEDYFNNSDLDDNYLEPHVEVTENLDENSIRQVADLQKNINNGNNANDPAYMPNEDDSDSVHSEYLPKKSHIKVKRGRGRPRKRPLTTSGLKNARLRSRYPKIESYNDTRENDDVKDDDDDDDDDYDDDENNGEFACPDCKEIFPKIKLLDQHARQKHTGLKLLHKCKQCTRQFSRYSHLKRHLQTHSILKPFECSICHKCFNRKDHLNKHFKLHNRKMEHECDVCNRMFNRMDMLLKHKAAKHNIGEKIMNEKKYECSVCLKSFTTEKYRDIHTRGHQGEKRFKCRICDKGFLSKSHLTEHMKFHSENSKKFLCSECGQRFIRNDYLVIHMRRHRGEKPFKCKYCGKGFPRTTDLTVHERYHTGEKTHLCTICGRGFGRAYNLTVHMRTHTGEKPYQCTYCEAAFAQGNDLKAHVRRHTGERFHCELCTDSFLMGYLLTQHKRVVHGLNVVSNIRRLQPITKIKEDLDEANPPITIQLPKPIIPDIILTSNIQVHMHNDTSPVVDMKILGP